MSIEQRNSHRAWADVDLDLVLCEADREARRLARRLGLPVQECEDLRQDLLADLLSRVHSYDAGRGTLGAFAGTVFRHRAARIANAISRRRRLLGEVPLGDVLSDLEGAMADDSFSEADGYAALFGQQTDAFALVERLLDLEQALRVLEPSHRRLCNELLYYTPTEVSRLGRRSRASIYRDLKEVRLRLLAFGFWPT